jgi:hypothetical protein
LDRLTLHLPSLTHSAPDLKQLQGVSSFCFTYVYTKSINHIPSASYPPFTLPPFTSTLLYLLYSPVFHYEAQSQCSKGFSTCPTVSLLHFGRFNSFCYFPLLLSSPTAIIQQLSKHIILSSTCTDVKYFNIAGALSLFSFPFFPEFHRVGPLYRHVLHLSLYMVMLVFVHMFIFGSIFHI